MAEMLLKVIHAFTYAHYDEREKESWAGEGERNGGIEPICSQAQVSASLKSTYQPQAMVFMKATLRGQTTDFSRVYALHPK